MPNSINLTLDEETGRIIRRGPISNSALLNSLRSIIFELRKEPNSFFPYSVKMQNQQIYFLVDSGAYPSVEEKRVAFLKVIGKSPFSGNIIDSTSEIQSTAKKETLYSKYFENDTDMKPSDAELKEIVEIFMSSPSEGGIFNMNKKQGANQEDNNAKDEPQKSNLFGRTK
ncbi:hypothetical protein [Legionella gresilensis]|uniref:hypothetical protein n=1 Tax=Legionella gresilensis TaxID=91823 RepID=UPI0010411497|nr:hypothetical protein [Legionella gresilensis]